MPQDHAAFTLAAVEINQFPCFIIHKTAVTSAKKKKKPT